MGKLLEMTASIFWSRVAEPDANGCSIWTGKVDAYGYGQVRWRKWIGRRVGKVHRIAWELRHGPIPAGMHVLHRCDNPPCVTDGHLFLGTQADNQRDMSAKGRNHNSRKTHCKRGHEYTPQNTKVTAKGARHCRMCQTIWTRDYLARKAVAR